MGDNSIKSNICGLSGKGCALGDYPVCDRHQMIGVSRLPGGAPTNPSELQSWVDRWVETVGSYGGICQQSGIWSVYYGSRESAPLDEAPLTPSAAQAAGPAKAETDQEIEDADEKPTGWKTYLVIAGASIFLGLSLVAGTTLAWKRISKWRSSKPIAKAPPPPLGTEKAEKPAATAAQPIPIGPKVVIPDKSSGFMLDFESTIGVMRQVDRGLAGLPESEQRRIAQNFWENTLVPGNAERFIADGRFTIDAVHHWRAISRGSKDFPIDVTSVMVAKTAEPGTTIGAVVFPADDGKEFLDVAESSARIEMGRIDPEFAALPAEIQKAVAHQMLQEITSNHGLLMRLIKDRMFTVEAVKHWRQIVKMRQSPSDVPVDPKAAAENPVEAAREAPLEPVPIGPKAIGEGPYKAGDPMPKGVMKALASIEHGFSDLPPKVQRQIAKEVWTAATSAPENMRFMFRDGRLTVDALGFWRVHAWGIGRAFKRTMIGDKEVTLGRRILPKNFQGDAMEYIPKVIEEMRKIDTLFARLPEETQARIAKGIVTVRGDSPFQDGRLTVEAVATGHGLARGLSRKIAEGSKPIEPKPIEPEAAKPEPAKPEAAQPEAPAEAEQPRVSKVVTRHIDASREGAIIHEKLMREFPKVEGVEYSFASMEESERQIVVEGILMQIEDSIERNAWREHFVVADGQRAFKPGALGRLLERHLETANHPSLEGFRNLGRAETRRVPERSAERGKHGMAPPPPRPTDKPHRGPAK